MDPVKIEVSNKFQTPKTLVQQYLFIPSKWKDCYLAYVLDEFKGQSTIIFAATCNNALRLTLMLRNLGFQVLAHVFDNSYTHTAAHNTCTLHLNFDNVDLD